MSLSSLNVVFLNDSTRVFFSSHLESIPGWVHRIPTQHQHNDSLPPTSDCQWMFHRPLTPIIDTLLTFTPCLSRQVGKQISGFRKAHTDLQKANYNSQHLPTLFHPIPVYLVHWAKLNFLKCILEYVEMDPACPQDKASLPEEADSILPSCVHMLSPAHCSLTQWLSVLLCLRHSLRSSRQANSARKWSPRSNLKQQGMRMWDQQPYSSAQHHCLEVCFTQPLGDWASSTQSSNLLTQPLWAFFICCLVSLTLHYFIYWEFLFK